MSARDDLLHLLDAYRYPKVMLAAFEAEVLNKAADALALELTTDGAPLPGYPLAVKSAVRALRRMSDKAAVS